MQHHQILEVLNDWNFWKKDIETGFKREDYLSRLKRLAELNEIVIITGVRRSGKSTLLLQYCKGLLERGVRKEDILIVNFEDPRLKELNRDLLNKIYEVYLSELSPHNEHYVVLDEVQVIDGWEKFARYLHENKKVNVFVTGSSSKLLSFEYATVLAGRHVDMEVFPLSFKEFLQFHGIITHSLLDVSSQRHKIKRAFKEYLQWGGFPKIALTTTDAGKRELLSAYFRDIVVKDIVMRYKIKELEKLEELAKYYLTNISNMQSFNSIKKMLNMNLDTVERFSYYLTYAHMLFFIKKFSYSKKEQIVNPRKVYAIDLGLRNSVSFVFSKDHGRLAENIVFSELKKKQDEIYYWRDQKQREVDFVVKQKTRIHQLIQVCWDAEDLQTKERETKPLIAAAKALKCNNLIVITEDFENEEKIDKKKITFVPLWKWLLAKESI
ncbi:MAG: ATP-binding protein [Nanoarchaeota archaeon]